MAGLKEFHRLHDDRKKIYEKTHYTVQNTSDFPTEKKLENFFLLKRDELLNCYEKNI